MREYTNKDRWRHIKHFVDTHPYSEDNLEYLKTWITQFTAPPKESWVGVDDPNQNSYLMNDGSTHSPHRESTRYENISDNSNHDENVSDKNQSEVRRCDESCKFCNPEESRCERLGVIIEPYAECIYDTLPRTVKCITCGKEVVYYCGFYIGTSDEDKVGPFCSKCMDDELKS